jgi:L-lactate dehydrogenase complex protein LldG
MSAARAEILGRVRSSLARDRVPSVASGHDSRPAGRPPGTESALAESFRNELAQVAGTAHGPFSPAEAREAALAIAGEAGPKLVLAWDQGELPVPGLTDALRSAGHRLCPAELPAEADARTARLREMAEAGVGLTGAIAGVSDTGSLVLASGPGRPRLAWLLPPVHLALLRVQDLYPDLGAWLAEGAERVRGCANVVVVTGPSRSGDIELILTRGVHGPGTLHVILVR